MSNLLINTLDWKSGDNVPQKMLAARVHEFGKSLQIEEVPTPKPASGEVLIRVEACSITSLDLFLTTGVQTSGIKTPFIPGFEGTGYVVESGGGISGWYIKGKKVAFFAKKNEGCWSEYTLADVNNCIPLDDDQNLDKITGVFSEPLLVVALYDLVKREKHQAVVHTDANSSLGRLLFRYFTDNGIVVINVVQNQDDMDRLEGDFQGIHVLNASAKDFKERLRELATKLKASCGLDAVCGEVTKDILNALPKESVVFVYGILSNEAIKDIDPRDLLFDEKELRGFCMLPYVEEMGVISKLKLVMELRKTLRGVGDGGATTEFGLDNINEALEFCKNNLTKGKVIIKI